ncbi:hypothetical protein OX283_004175 [Flavobacterium sp. SUN052]|uniref:hypothetical protein n=1 Tax=Flavobacterium sp. SUN052 TaxID=3002441 RepID=UPI00237E636E|nr:hypothetical protein [Flavobacterium sp. SUN052]MEC4003842.1 hypothetical protein [Flavobacterium sp. SUN052]
MKYELKFCRFIIYGFLLFLTSCNSKEELLGQYIGSFKNNIDSLKINSKGRYERVIYDNSGKKIFSNKSTYKIEGGFINFNDFLLNEDDLSTSSNYDPTDVVVASLPYSLTFSGMKITSNFDLEYFYIKK